MRKQLNIEPYEYAEKIKTPKSEFDKFALQYKETLDRAIKYNTERKSLYCGFAEERVTEYLSDSDLKRYNDLTIKYNAERKKLNIIYNNMEKEYSK